MSTASSLVLANIPSPDRGVWDIGPFSLRAYALCIIVGIVVAIWLGERRWQARGGTKGTVIDVAVWAAPMGLIGGRLYHVITDHQLYFGEGRDPIRALYIWEGGLGIWGAIALGAVGAWIACRRRGIPLPALADAVAPGIIIAQAVGRLGNYFNQELYGGPTSMPWGLEIYRRVDPGNPAIEDPLGGVAVNDVPVEVVHPTFLYELLWNLGIALLIIWLDRRFRLGHGRVFALYVAGYTAGRFWIELMRTDPANEILGLRINVWTSVVVFLGAVVYFVLARRKGPREAPETLRSEDDERNDGEAGVVAGPAAGGAVPVGSTAADPGGPPTEAGSAPTVTEAAESDAAPADEPTDAPATDATAAGATAADARGTESDEATETREATGDPEDRPGGN